MGNIKSWRDTWGDFYHDTVDELIVFSESSKTIFTKAYPFLHNKITITPHEIVPFKHKLSAARKTEMPEFVNIAMLGNLIYIKGEQIITEMAELTKYEPYKNIKLTVIGDYNIENNITVTGQYNREDLPALIEKHNIDIIFISSICPETYSYTTTEAMTLELPVACFNIGAPAERIANYNKGLIISDICPKKALEEITEFVKKWV